VRFVVFIPVGPDPEDLRRLEAVTESLDANVDSSGGLVLVDDGPAGRDLLAHVAWNPEQTAVLRSPLAGSSALANDRMTASTLVFLSWLSASPYEYALKLDTDALVIGDFRPGLEAAFQDPALGLCGACERNVAGGALRDISLWRRQLLLACSPVQVRTGSAPRRIGLHLSGTRARQRRFLTRAVISARRHGYRLGEHCLGGSYAVSGAAARAIQIAGDLDDPTITQGTGLSEDVILALLLRSAGFRLRSLVACGEPFALQHRGLLASPEELVAADHAVVHSLKTGDPDSERGLVESFVRLRRLRD
jgi:hypothetical protein